ncbi:MAG: DUF1549 and DUF1553 domain-containing protein [Planctomycetota bacterium]|nr:DUF1549 and DUF1553 domain-containing protein [Planctomycetota bacterium]
MSKILNFRLGLSVATVCALSFSVSYASGIDDDFHQTKRVDVVTPEPTWTADQKGHWAFQPIRRVEPPQVRNQNLVRNPIDQFVLSQVEKMGLKPSAEADKLTLIRRVTFDLTGLPPTPEEIRAFQADARPEAYNMLVESLLNRKAYGERWARWWLDLARYAESDGFKADVTRPNAWRYRDWVIGALNSDMPYDKFLGFQLAGDELAPNQPEAFIATGLNRHYPFEDNNMVPGLNRQLILDDIADTNASLFMGLTVACARCHDHKYDPISQKDYYRFQALFGGLVPKDDYPLGNAVEVALNATVQSEYEVRKASLEKALTDIEQPYWTKVLEPVRQRMSQTTLKALETDPGQRTDLQVTTIRNAMKTLKVSSESVVAAMTPADRERWTAMKGGLGGVEKMKPSPLPIASGMTDSGRDAAPVHLLLKGNFHRQAEVIEPGFLSVLSDQKQIEKRPTGHATTGTRTALVNWLTRPDHPLTSRVIVNRVWQQHFGRGIVTTTSDFGTQGMEPSHPELLDWLASTFMSQGWRFRDLHRMMVTSATYRQSSRPSAQAIQDDPDNMLLSHQTRRRLDAEMVRDGVLLVSGRLNSEMGGPSVRPPMPAGLDVKDWTVDKDEASHRRRSVYIFVKRNVKHPFLDAFDYPDSNLTCPERLVSINAPQALMLLNSDFALDESKALAERLIRERPRGTDQERFRDLWIVCFSRIPSEAELARLSELSATLRARLGVVGRVGSDGLSEKSSEWRSGEAERAVWSDLCHVVLNLNEFVFVD